MEPRYYLRCLGDPALHDPAGEIVRLRSRKNLALLAYLSVEHRVAHSRDHLADLLWPGAARPEARHSLSTALYILRGRLGPETVVADREKVHVVRERIDLDLDRLEAGEVLGNEVIPPLAVGFFMETIGVTDAPAFDLWKDQQQASLQPSIAVAFVQLMDRCRRTGDFRQIEHYADRLLSFQELSEAAIRAKMEARAFAGERLMALQVFEEWKARLHDELGAAPSRLVEGMAIRLRRRGWEGSRPMGTPAVVTDQWKGRSFVGRAVEYRTLYERWERIRQGEAAHTIVLGDSGVGKTTLVERVTTAAALEGAAVSRTQCYDVEREIPYTALVSLLQGLLDQPGVSATPPEALAELSRTLPSIRLRYPNLPPSLESHGESARVLLAESTQELLLAIGEEHPVVLVIDDVHQCDDASLAILHSAMRRMAPQHLVVLLLARPGELHQSPNASKLREHAETLHLRELELKPLSESESAELLRLLLVDQVAQPSLSVRRSLLRAAGGLPMVLELLARDWRLYGDDSLALTVDAITAEPRKSDTSLDPYHRLLDRLMRSLSSSDRNVLNIASLLGSRLNDLSFYTLLDLSLSGTMSGLSKLTELCLLRDGSQGLEFANELARARAYLAIPLAVRRVLHSEIADQLIRRARTATKQSGLEIAWHCMRSSRETEATEYVLRGGREAINAGALHEAERGLSTSLPHFSGSMRDDALMLLAELYQEQGRWEESLQSLALLSAKPTACVGELKGILVADAERRTSGGTLEGMAQSFEEVLQRAQDATYESNRIRALGIAARFANALHDRHAAFRLQALLEERESHGLSAEDRCRRLLARAMVQYNLRKAQITLEEIDAATREYEARGSFNSVVVRLRIGVAAIQMAGGHYQIAIPHLRSAISSAERLDNEDLCLQASANLALCYSRLGQNELAIRTFESLVHPHTHLLMPTYIVPGAQGAAISKAVLGKKTEALTLLGKLSPMVDQLCLPWLSQAWALTTADVLTLVGELDQALVMATSQVTRAIISGEYADASAGALVRWTAICSTRRLLDRTAVPLISEIAQRLGDFDSVDQYEIVAATSFLGLPIGRSEEELSEDGPKSTFRHLPLTLRLQIRGLHALAMT